MPNNLQLDTIRSAQIDFDELDRMTDTDPIDLINMCREHARMTRIGIRRQDWKLATTLYAGAFAFRDPDRFKELLEHEYFDHRTYSPDPDDVLRLVFLIGTDAAPVGPTYKKACSVAAKLKPFFDQDVEPAERGAFRRQVVRQEAPGDPTAQDVEDGIEHITKRPFARSPAGAWRWKMRFDQSPFGIGQIGFIAQAAAAMLQPRGRRPHGASRSDSAPSWNQHHPGRATFRDGLLGKPRMCSPEGRFSSPGGGPSQDDPARKGVRAAFARPFEPFIMNLHINNHAALFWFLLSRLRARDGLGSFPEGAVAYAERMIDCLASLTSDSDRLPFGALNRVCPTCHRAAGPWPVNLTENAAMTPGYRSIVALALELSGFLVDGLSLEQANVTMVDVLGLEREGLLIADAASLTTTPLGEARFGVHISVLRSTCLPT